MRMLGFMRLIAQEDTKACVRSDMHRLESRTLLAAAGCKPASQQVALCSQVQQQRHGELAAALAALQGRHAALAAEQRSAAAAEAVPLPGSATDIMHAGGLGAGALVLRAAVMSPRDGARRKADAPLTGLVGVSA